MKFLVDANLPPGLATWLRQDTYEAIHVSDQPGLNLDDRAIFEFARQHGYTILTAALRTSVQRGRPFGSEGWVVRTAKRLGLVPTLQPRGRPKGA
jgi:predicted nuclease of predicted toxin-antitoxin system